MKTLSLTMQAKGKMVLYNQTQTSIILPNTQGTADPKGCLTQLSRRAPSPAEKKKKIQFENTHSTKMEFKEIDIPQ
jgi:hypothetical protein